MISIELNNETKRSIELSTGIPYSQIEELDAESIDRLIEEKIKKPLSIVHAKRDWRLPARGGVFLTLNRFVSMSQIDKKISLI